MSTDSYITALTNKLKSISSLLDGKRAEVKKILEEIHGLEKQADSLLNLLEVEGYSVDEFGLEIQSLMSVSDMAFEALVNKSDKKPIHYRKIADIVASNSRLIPGKDPAANLVAHMSRDSRFIRTSRGTYGLAEWGLTPMKKTVRKKKRRG